MICLRLVVPSVTAICLVLGSQAAAATDLQGCWKQGATNIHPADGGAPRRIDTNDCLTEFGPQMRTRLCIRNNAGATVVSSYTITGPDSLTEKILRDGDREITNGEAQAKTYRLSNPNTLILTTPPKDPKASFSATFFSRVAPTECADRAKHFATKSGGGTSVGQGNGQGNGQGAGTGSTNYRIVRTEQCLFAAVAASGFDFNDDAATRVTLDSIISKARRNGCEWVGALLMESRGQSECTLRDFHPAFVQSGSPLNCVAPKNVAHAYRQSTPPGSVMNFESGKEIYWNSVATPKERIRKQAEETRIAKARDEQMAAAAAEQEGANARARALASLKNTVVSTSSKPSEADMKRRIEERININSRGFIRLIGFQKKDGMDREIAGMKTYNMEWVAVLEFTGDCVWNKNSFEAAPPPEGTNGILFASSGYQPVKKGQRINLSGETTMKRTENGWRE